MNNGATMTTTDTTSRWFGDWQNQKHVTTFDFRSRLDDANLLREYEAFNDVRLLNERLDPPRKCDLLEIGCATGEFSRYVRLKHPNASYRGFDISVPAVARAREKYPDGAFWVTDPKLSLSEQLSSAGLVRPDIVYSKDVVIHHTDPFGFIAQLLSLPKSMLVMRLRTRDKGETELNPDLACQYHYSGWMPYMVLNLDDTIRRLREQEPKAEIVVYRNHMVLGGQNARYLPKDCYLPETGTSETAIGVFKETSQPGAVTIVDREDARPRYNLRYKLGRLLRKLASRELF